MSVKLKEFILEELASDKGLKERYDVLLEKRFGSMARFFHAIAEETQDEIIRAILPQDMKQLEGNQFLLENFEGFIRFDLLKKARKKFPGQFSDDEFEITYIEAKEDYIALRKNKEMKAVAKQREAPLELPEPRKPEGEKTGYVVFLPRPKGGTGVFIDNKTKTENQVHQKYSTKKEKFDIFVYEQNVYKKVMDEGKAKMISINPSISFRGLLILFLKYKDVALPYVELYHKAFCGTAEHKRDAEEPSDVMNTLKNAVNELKREFDYIKGFSIPRAKNSAYKCEGDFQFCLILKRPTNEHYTMLFKKKFKFTESIPEEV